MSKSLEVKLIFEKESNLVHRCNLTKHSFALHGFFLEPKTAYLEALLYSNSRLLMCLILYHPLKIDLINSNTCSYSGLYSILLQNEIQQIMGCIMIQGRGTNVFAMLTITGYYGSDISCVE